MEVYDFPVQDFRCSFVSYVKRFYVSPQRLVVKLYAWGDLGIDPLDLRKKQEKSSLVFKIIKQGKNSFFCKKRFFLKNGINVKFHLKGESSGRSVF